MARVLIADDAMFMRESIKKMLLANGHEVAGESEDGKETIEKFMECKPDLVILDITMPGMNGIDVLKYIMELDAEARVIICSAIGQTEVIAKAIQLGAKDFIVKPFGEEQMIGAIEKVMK